MKIECTFFRRMVYTLILLISTGYYTKAQTFTIQTVSGDRCVAVNGTNTLRILTNPVPNASAVTVWDWDTPNLVKAGQGTLVSGGNTQYYVDVQGPAPTAAGAFCPAKVAFKWKVVSPACTTSYLGSNQATCLVYKSFTKVELDAKSIADGTGTYEIYTESPPCVQTGDLVNVSIRPYNLCNGNGSNAQTTEEIAPDQITWSSTNWGSTPLYTSADGTSATFRVLAAVGSQQVTVRIGRCNQGSPTVSRNFNVQPVNTFLTATGAFSSNVPGAPGVTGGPSIAGNGCLPQNVGSPITFTANSNPAQIAGTVFLWDWPTGYTPVGATNGNTLTLTPLTGANTISGNVSVTINNGQCGRVFASYNVDRTLNGNTITLTPAPSRTVADPAPTGNNLRNECVYPDLTYNFRLDNAPLNNTYIWEPTTGTNFWANQSGQGSVNFTARANKPINTNTYGSPPSWPLLVNGNGLIPACTSSVSRSANLATMHTASSALDTRSLVISRTGTNCVIQTSGGNPTWFSAANGFTCPGQTLSASNFYYEWGFTGIFDPDAVGEPNVNNQTSISQVNNAAIFSSAPNSTGINSITLKPGTFLSGSTIYCRIRKINNAPCGSPNQINNCFYAYVEFQIP